MSGETQGKSITDRIIQRNYGLWRSLRRGWGRFTQRRLGVIGLLILIGLIAMAVFAPAVAPHDLDWRAPQEAGGGESCETLECKANQETISHPAPPKFGGLTGDPYFAPLGTDHTRADILTKIVFGSRTALYIGLAAGLLSSLVGVPLGLISGFYGDTWIDETIQRLADITYGLPFLPLLIVLVAIRGVNTTNIILGIVVKSWVNNCIIIRGETLSLKERSYVESAKVAGASDTRVIFRHILPNVLPLSFVYLAQDAAGAILAEASLAYLGLSDFTAYSWGIMLQQIQGHGYVFSAWWWLVPPGLAITLIAAAFYFIGFSMEDVANPQR